MEGYVRLVKDCGFAGLMEISDGFEYKDSIPRWIGFKGMRNNPYGYRCRVVCFIPPGDLQPTYTVETRSC
jgi:hypothetical protein